MPDVWLCGTTYCHTRRSKNDGAAAGRAAADAAAAGGGGSAGPAKKNCPIFGHGAREYTNAFHKPYQGWAGETGAYIITLQSARVARSSLREAEPGKR